MVKKVWVGPLRQSTKGNLPWVCDYACPLSGKKKRKKIAEAGANQKARTDLYHDFRSSLTDGRTITQENATVDDALVIVEKWYEERHEANDNVSAGTLVRIKSAIKVHLRPDLGPMLLSKLDSPAIEKYIWQKSKTSKAKFSDLKQVIRTTLHRAVWENLLSISPLDVKPIRTPPRPPSTRTIPTIEEGRALYHALLHEGRSNARISEHCNITRMTTVSLAMFGGMCCGEMAGLLWEHVNFIEQWIWVEHSLSRYGAPEKRLKDPKQPPRHRYIPLSEEMNHWLTLTAQRDGNPSTGHVLKPEPGNRNRNWTTAEGNHLLRSMTSQFQAAQVRLGFVKNKGKARWTMHEMRHYAGSVWLLDPNYRMEDVSRMLGHGRLSTTQKYYMHHIKKQNLERDRAMMARMSKLHRLPSSPPPIALANPMRHSCDIDGESR